MEPTGRGPTIFLQLRGPYGIWDTRQVGRYNFLSFETVSENAERAPRSPTAYSEDLGAI